VNGYQERHLPLPNELTIRPAQAGDTERAVPLIYSSGPPMFEFAFTDGDRTAQDFLRWAFARGRSLFGHGIHRVGTLDGEVVGTFGLYTRAQGKRISRRLIPEIMRFYGLAAGLRTLRRGLKTEAAVPPPPDGRLYICHVGVREELRGRGLGGAMLQQALSECKQRRLIPALDVAITNVGARQLYERMGFEVLIERPGPADHLPAQCYMERRQ